MKKNNQQMSFDFDTPVNKPWWMGIVCMEMHYFDLLSMGVKIEDLMIPWEIEDYQKTLITLIY